MIEKLVRTGTYVTNSPHYALPNNMDIIQRKPGMQFLVEYCDANYANITLVTTEPVDRRADNSAWLAGGFLLGVFSAVLVVALVMS
jgi:hypothetical protein